MKNSFKKSFKASMAVVMALSMVLGMFSMALSGALLGESELNYSDNIIDERGGEPPPDDGTQLIVNQGSNDPDDDDDEKGIEKEELENEEENEELEQGISASGIELDMASSVPTVLFFIDGILYHTSNNDNSSWPTPPTKLNLDFAGWFDANGNEFFSNSELFEGLELHSLFTATINIVVDGVTTTHIINENTIFPRPADPDAGPDREFINWISLGANHNFDLPVTRHFNITAFFMDIVPEQGMFDHLWLAGPGGSIRDATCGNCRGNSGNQFSAGVQLYFHPQGQIPPGASDRQLSWIVMPCRHCGEINYYANESNNGATLARVGAAPSGSNNINLGGITPRLPRTITFLPGNHGLLLGQSVWTYILDETPWNPRWEPGVSANDGWVFLGWLDQNGNRYDPNATNFPNPIRGNYTFTAQYSDFPILTISATSGAKVYDGTALTAGFTHSVLPTGFTVSGVNVSGSITDVGTATSRITNTNNSGIIVRDNSGRDVTDQYIIRTTTGTLTITARPITITAASDSKAFDGSALTNNGWSITEGSLAAGQTIASVTVNGSQTNPGSSSNNASAAVIRNAAGTNVSGNYTITYLPGTLTVTNNTTASIVITAASASKQYDGTPLTNSNFTNSPLPAGVTRITATVAGSQTIVGSSANVVTGYTLWNGSQNVTAFFPTASYVNGTLTVTPSSAVVTITAASDSKQYDGTPLTNSGYSTSNLPSGVTRVEAVVAGSQTDVGSSANVVTGYTLWNGTQNVTAFYPAANLVTGTLTVTASPAVITITAADDSKVYDGTPLTNDGYSNSNLPAGVTRVEAVVEGSQTNVGSSANVVKGYTLWNGTQDVTAFFAAANLVDGELTVTPSPAVITITAASDSKVFDGTPLTNDDFDTSELPEGVTHVTAVIEGSQTDVGSSENVVISYKLWNGEQDVTENFAEAIFVDGTLTVTASADVIVITAASDNKAYDGTPLTNSNYTNSTLPAGVTRVEAVVEGSQTNVGSSANVVTGYILWNGTQDVTEFFPEASLVDGTLLVTPNAAVVTITAASDSKTYDGTPLTNNNYTNSALPAGVTRVEAVVEGSQTNVGSSANVVTGYTLWNGTQDVTEFFAPASFVDGTLTVTASAAPITITAASDSKEYDGTPLTNSNYTNSALPAGVTRVEAVVEGSQTNVGSSANVVTGYTLWNGTQDVTSFFTNVNTAEGTLEVTINQTAVVITAASDSKQFDGTPLTNSGYGFDALPPGVTNITVVVEGSQTEVGSSDNEIKSYRFWNGSQNVTSFFVPAELIDGTLTVIANNTPIIITAASDSKQFDGTPLTNAGFGHSALPAGVTNITAVVEGSQTEVGSSSNKVVSYRLWNGSTEVTNSFIDITYVYGLLEVTPNTDVITITAASDSKVYDGTPLTNSNFTYTDLPAGVTRVTATVEGSQLNAGSSANTVTGYTLWNNDKDVTEYFAEANLVDGTLEVTRRVIVITIDDKEKEYGEEDPDLTYEINDEPEDGDEIEITIVREPGEEPGDYIITIIEGDNPNYEIIVEDGTITIKNNSTLITITAANDSKVYDGTPLINNNYSNSELPNGVTRVEATVVGSQTDVGSSENVVFKYTLWNENENVTAFFSNVETIDGTLTVTQNAAVIVITAASDVKEYDGTPLTNGNSSHSDLPAGVTRVIATVEGSQTDVGSSANVVRNYRLLNGDRDVTTFFPPAILIEGTLTVIQNTTVITITAADDSKLYDGTPLTNSNYATSELPAGVTHVTATVVGSQTDVGSSENVVTVYTLWNGGQDVTEFFVGADLKEGTLTVTENDAAITITAASDSKAYDGTPLTNSNFTHSNLPAGVTSVTASVAGSQTDVGSSDNVVTVYTLWNGSQNVTEFFPSVNLVEGTLTVTPSTEVITITAADDSKQYDGTPLTNSDYETSELPAGVTHVTATVVGSQTDVGDSPNVVTVYTFWNGDQDVTEFFPPANRVEGTLEVTQNQAVIVITAANDSKAYDGTPLTNSNYGTSELPAGVTEVRATVEGSQTNVGSSANVVTAYTLWNGDKNVTAFFADAALVNGTLTVTGSNEGIVITAASDSKAYDGTPLTNSNFSNSTLPAGVTEVRATVNGSQTDVGSSANEVTAYTLWNGDQNVTAFFNDVTLVEGTLTITANAAPIEITAASDSKEFDGTPLINSNFSNSALPAGVTHVTAIIEGSQTDVGSSANEVAGYTLWNGSQDVTAFFTSVTLTEGTLEVTANSTVITITAGSDSKEYDGTPLTNDDFSHTDLPEGVTHITVTIVGEQTDPGSSDNVVFEYTLWNGDEDVTEFFPNIILEEGTLTIHPGSAAIVITAASDEKEYDGTPLTNSSYEHTELPAGVTSAEITVVGSQTDVGASPNVVYDYTLWNGDQDVTGFFPNVTLIEGTLTVIRNTTVITITAGSDSKEYDGSPLTSDDFETSDLPPGVTHVTVKTEGSQTDPGSSDNEVVEYIYWNGDQDVTEFFVPPVLEEGTLTVTPNQIVITITAADDEKEYDGLPLINNGFETSDLPAGVTHVTATVEGSQTDVGSSPNVVTGYTLWNGDQDVTEFFADAELIDGTLTVIRSTAVITITAGSDSKEYDGTPITSDDFDTSDLPPGVTHVTVKTEGSQTDPGSSDNDVIEYIFWNGDQDVTDFFAPPILEEGTLEITQNLTVIIVTAVNDHKQYDGTPLINPDFYTSDLPAGVTHVTATVVGSQTDVGSSPNEAVAYTLWNGDQDVTEFFVEATLVNGTLTVTVSEEVVVITAVNDYKQYDGTPLTNDDFYTSDLPAGVTHVTATVEGSQTDVGNSPNVVTGYTLWNGDQDVTAFFVDAAFVPGTLTVIPSTAPITITADSDSKQYDGTPLINDGFTHTELPPGVTHVTAVVAGEQTDPGSSPNELVEYRLWNGEQDVTDFFTNVTPEDGTLTVEINQTVVTITAADDSKEYDGTPLTNSDYETSELPPGVTHITAKVVGEQTDVGESPNTVVEYTYWNGDQDVTDFFVAPNLEEGTLTVTVNQTVVEITAADDSKEYDGTPLTNSGYGFSDLPAGITNVTTTIEGSQTDVGESPNVIVRYRLWNGSQDVTAFFVDAILNPGTLTVTPSSAPITITAASDSKPYDGSPLTNDGFGFTTLPAGVTSITATVEGSQTDVGSSDNVVTAYQLWNGSQNVTAFFPNITLDSGLLTVTPNQVSITVVANSASKVFDGTPITADGFSSTMLPPGVTHITTTIVGSQTAVGSSSNTIIIVTLWNGTQDVTEFFPNIILLPGLLTVTAAPTVLTPPAPPVLPEPPVEETEIGELVTPLAPPAPAPAPVQPEDNDIIITIIDGATPLAAAGPGGFWALWNLILSIAGALLALMMGIRILITKNRQNKEEEDEQSKAQTDETEEEEKGKKRRRLLLILAVPILAIIAIVVFILTQDMRLQISLIDWWTLLHAIAFVAGLVCYFFAFRRKKDEEDDDEEQVTDEIPQVN